jgi:hypothetical protein
LPHLQGSSWTYFVCTAWVANFVSSRVHIWLVDPFIFHQTPLVIFSYIYAHSLYIGWGKLFSCFSSFIYSPPWALPCLLNPFSSPFSLLTYWLLISLTTLL